MGTTNKDVHIKAIFTVMNLSSTESEAWKKIQVCTGFEPVTTSGYRCKAPKTELT